MKFPFFEPASHFTMQREIPWTNWSVGLADLTIDYIEGRASSRPSSGWAKAADLIREYTEKRGFEEMVAHDPWRTFAKLAHKGDAKLDQIQLSLEYASSKTMKS